MPDLVFELGTEEMPPGAIAPALQQLRESLAAKLLEARLGVESIEVVGAPRRLIAFARGIPENQPDQPREAKGPSVSAAYDASGAPTGAAIGFAKKQGVAVEALERVSTPQGEYIIARVVDQGQPAVEVLGKILTETVLGLTFPKMMRWGNVNQRFVRPVRWILAMLGRDVITMEIAGVRSGNRSRGHRFLAPEEFDISAPGELLPRLKNAFVMADPEERRAEIRRQADSLASEADGRIPWDEGLLDENTWLVEWPTALLGSFDPQYLELPRPVLVTAMKKHQRFFPVEDSAGRLLPKFIAVRSGGDRSLDIVREGNERVLTARFADAAYFYEQDRARSLDDMADSLDRILFQDKLGTMAQKRARLQMLAESMASAMGLSSGESEKVKQAASLAKADLTSQMVTELPALQGIVGREYAVAQSVDPGVAEAIAEHYQPRSAADALPESLLGKLLAVADRVDTLVGYVGIGILPSGSSDPFGLRRAAQGVVQILAREPDFPSLGEIEVQAAQAYESVNGLDFPLDELINSLRELFDQRIDAYLQERGIRYDLVSATLYGGSVYDTLVYAVVKRAETLQKLAADPDFPETVRVAERVANILRSAKQGPLKPFMPGKEGIHGSRAMGVERAVSILESQARSVDRNLLQEGSEQVLFGTANQVLPEVARRAATYDYEGVYRALAPLRPAVDRFFDDVLVMADDQSVRANRLALLSLINVLYRTIADFTKVVTN